MFQRLRGKVAALSVILLVLFYLGYRISAIFQLMLTPLGYAMLMTKSSTGLLLVPAAGLWILADAFLIPGMVTAANERARGASLASTFA